MPIPQGRELQPQGRILAIIRVVHGVVVTAERRAISNADALRETGPSQEGDSGNRDDVAQMLGDIQRVFKDQHSIVTTGMNECGRSDGATSHEFDIQMCHVYSLH